MTYTFDISSNSYFGGHDVVVTRNDGRPISINRKDRMLAIEVKDDVTYHHYPADVQRALDDLGEDRTQGLYERAVDEYWHWANEAAREHGFADVYSEGRSGGWLAVDETQHWEDEEIVNPQTDEARANRKRFFDFAFEAVNALDHFRDLFFEHVREAHKAWLTRPASYSVAAFPIMEDGRSLDAIAEHTAEDAVTCFAKVGRACEQWINDPESYQWEDGHEPQIDLTLTWKPSEITRIERLDIPPEEQVCACGHWYDEHDFDHQGDDCNVEGCPCTNFRFDPCENTPQAIADRGGDPNHWPEHVKQYFQARIDQDTLAALREVAAGRIDQFSVGELEDIGLTNVTSQAGRTDDDALMQQAEQILEAHSG